MFKPTSSRLAGRSSAAAARSFRATDNGAPEPDSRQDHVSRVYHELRGLIVRGQLAPGARIAERAVGERLGASRTPVRSALHRLQQEGFVSPDGRGRDQRLIVAPVTKDDGEELFDSQMYFEGLQMNA